MTDAGILSLRDVVFSYHRRQPVVRALSGRVWPGRVHALIGPNGCGKTTLLKLMLGEFRPDSGKVTMDGHPAHRLDAAQRAAWVSYVPQRSTNAFAFTVEQVVGMARYALPPDDGAVAQSLSSCDLLDMKDKSFIELSVGQQQRVLLARALAQSHGQGKVILLDEPTASMDLLHVHQTMGHLRLVASRGLAVVVVLQDLNLAARYADEVWLMDRGSLVACGPWDRVLVPEVLEPVYGVEIARIGQAFGRPVFSTGLRATMPDG